MELHFVHMRESGRLTVLAVRVVSGRKNITFSTIMEEAPRESSEQTVPFVLDPRQLLPNSIASSWRYEGSLTTPPCSQTVDWIVLNDPLEVALNDIRSFQNIFPLNARPLQLLGQRKLIKTG
jgi:carbonic anhydrase